MSSHLDAKTIVALVPHNPSYKHKKKQRKRQKQGPPPGPFKTAARCQLAAVSTARRHRLAVK